MSSYFKCPCGLCSRLAPGALIGAGPDQGHRANLFLAEVSVSYYSYFMFFPRDIIGMFSLRLAANGAQIWEIISEFIWEEDTETKKVTISLAMGSLVGCNSQKNFM